MTYFNIVFCITIIFIYDIVFFSVSILIFMILGQRETHARSSLFFVVIFILFQVYFCMCDYWEPAVAIH
jgi:hypothetical protein